MHKRKHYRAIAAFSALPYPFTSARDFILDTQNERQPQSLNGVGQRVKRTTAYQPHTLKVADIQSDELAERDQLAAELMLRDFQPMGSCGHRLRAVTLVMFEDARAN